MTFKEYLATRQVRDNPQGDFVLEARADLALPDVQSWPELRSHLEHSGASSETIETGLLVWKSYREKIKSGRSTSKRPKGRERPGNKTGTTVKPAKIAPGAKTRELDNAGRLRAAVELGRKGGKARARSLSAKRRKEIARKAALKRWGR